MSSTATYFRRFEGRCWYCDGEPWHYRIESKVRARARLGIIAGEPGSAKRLDYARATKEHIVRRADGGQGKDNFVLACLFCNSTRGTTEPERHREVMRALIANRHHPMHTPPQAPTEKQWRRQILRSLRQIRAELVPEWRTG